MIQMYVYMYLIFFKFFLPFRLLQSIEFSVLHSGCLLAVYLIYSSMYVSAPNFRFVLFEILNMEMGLLIVSNTHTKLSRKIMNS